MRIGILFCLVAMLYNCAYAQNHNILDVDFMQSMTDGNPEGEKLLTSDPEHSHYLKIVQDNYEAKKPSKMPYNDKPLIPKIMHHVWVGSSDLPPLYQNYLNECKKLHPDWEFKIWGDKEIAELGLIYQDLYDKMRSYPGKADILRYEVLYRFGGVYRDMDVKCFKPIDDLNHMYDFFIGTDGPFYFRYLALSNGLIGSKPEHKIIKDTLDLIKHNLDKGFENWDKNIDSSDIHMFAVENTMLPTTHATLSNITRSDKTIVFPPTYFYTIRNIPFGYKVIQKSDFPKLSYSSRYYFSFIKPESLQWHNDLKTEVNNDDFFKLSGMSDPLRRKKLKTLSPDQQKIFKYFGVLYDSNNSDHIGWSKNSRIPQVINFIVFNEDEMKTLAERLPDWQMLNGDFEINVWDKVKLINEFPELVSAFKPTKEYRLYAALKILEKFGGTYADFASIPYLPIFELNNKYNFYTGLMPINNKTTKISLSQKLIGASKNIPIISKTLSQINSENIERINEVLTLEVYKGVYLDGKNIVLPAAYFEPIDLVDHSVSEKITMFWKKVSTPLSELTKYTIVE
jgi:mannosyltransferase OCH1-like enzyme